MGNLLKKDAAEYSIIEHYENCGIETRVEAIALGGNKRTFRLGSKYDLNHPSIEIDGKVVNLDDGYPEISSMHNWVCGIIKDYKLLLY